MSQAKILLVDDDRDLVRGLSIRLKASGYDVISAYDGYSAVIQTKNEHPDLIILDLGLPGGDGFVVMERLLEFPDCASIPVITLTGRDQASNRERSLRAGAVYYLQKPADNEELLTAIRKALGNGGMSVDAGDAARRGVSAVSAKTILIVEDDKDVSRGLGIRLKASGYKICIAEDVYMALGLAQQEKPDLVLLDLGLPGGDGFTFMERLKSRAALAAIPIVILTARDPVSTQDRAMTAGASYFFQKPFDNAELLSAIRRVLSESTVSPVHSC